MISLSNWHERRIPGAAGAGLRLLLACVALLMASSAESGLEPAAEVNSRASVPQPLEASSPGYNLIFISLTNTRADHLGAYGYARATSPRIDALAKKSLLFRNVFAHASWTLPAVMSLFTSQYPFTHKLMNREEGGQLPAQIPTWVDVLKTNGYLTAAFVGNRDYSPKFGHTSRFHTVFDSMAKAELDDWKSYGVLENTVPAAVEWLRQNSRRKFFLLVQGYNTHCPFALPKAETRFDPEYRGKIDFSKCYWTFERTRPLKVRTASGAYQDVYLLKTKPTEGDHYEVQFYPEDVRHMVALYDGEIFNADAQIGVLFDEITRLGLEKNTIIVFFSDHGDMFGKHGRFMRGGPLRGTFYDDVLHVPLVIYHPGLAPRPIDGVGQVIDIGPTLLEWLGLPRPAGFRGKSLTSLLANSTVNETTFAGSAFTPSERNRFFRHSSIILSARSQRWKLILEQVALSVGPEESVELYDLQSDSAEMTNIASQHPAVVKEWRSRLRNWLGEIHATDVLSQFPP